MYTQVHADSTTTNRFNSNAAAIYLDKNAIGNEADSTPTMN
jgi:hypothetical protein